MLKKISRSIVFQILYESFNIDACHTLQTGKSSNRTFDIKQRNTYGHVPLRRAAAPRRCVDLRRVITPRHGVARQGKT